MTMRVRCRRLLPGVTMEEYWRAVQNGTREFVLSPPGELSLSAYKLVRQFEAVFGAAASVEGEVDAAAIRERIAEFDREWAQAVPCDRDGNPLPPEWPPSPLERRQRHPRHRRAKSQTRLRGV